jgi:hypothetical protein
MSFGDAGGAGAAYKMKGNTYYREGEYVYRTDPDGVKLAIYASPKSGFYQYLKTGGVIYLVNQSPQWLAIRNAIESGNAQAIAPNIAATIRAEYTRKALSAIPSSGGGGGSRSSSVSTYTPAALPATASTPWYESYLPHIILGSGAVVAAAIAFWPSKKAVKS